MPMIAAKAPDSFGTFRQKLILGSLTDDSIDPWSNERTDSTWPSASEERVQNLHTSQ